MDITSFPKPTIGLVLLQQECQQIAASEQKQDQEKDEICISSSLRIKTKCDLGEVIDEEDLEDGLKTPTSLEQKIPLVIQCPPAPRKPRSKAKRKADGNIYNCRRRILLDFSSEVESLFGDNFGGKIKKFRS